MRARVIFGKNGDLGYVDGYVAKGLDIKAIVIKDKDNHAAAVPLEELTYIRYDRG